MLEIHIIKQSNLIDILDEKNTFQFIKLRNAKSGNLGIRINDKNIFNMNGIKSDYIISNNYIDTDKIMNDTNIINANFKYNTLLLYLDDFENTIIEVVTDNILDNSNVYYYKVDLDDFSLFNIMKFSDCLIVDNKIGYIKSYEKLDETEITRENFNEKLLYIPEKIEKSENYQIDSNINLDQLSQSNFTMTAETLDKQFDTDEFLEGIFMTLAEILELLYMIKGE